MDYTKLSAVATAQNTAQNTRPVKVMSLDALDSIESAAKIRKTLNFVVTHGVSRGIPMFFAQLKGNRRFSCIPVMPRDRNGEVLAPPNGAEGYLTVEISENCQLTETDGRIEFSERPVFADFETPGERAKRLAAETAAGK